MARAGVRAVTQEAGRLLQLNICLSCQEEQAASDGVVRQASSPRGCRWPLWCSPQRRSTKLRPYIDSKYGLSYVYMFIYN